MTAVAGVLASTTRLRCLYRRPRTLLVRSPHLRGTRPARELDADGLTGRHVDDDCRELLRHAVRAGARGGGPRSVQPDRRPAHPLLAAAADKDRAPRRFRER